MFQLLYADSKGRMYEHPDLSPAARTGNLFTEVREEEMIPLPEGAALVLIPGGLPVGVDREGNFTVFSTDARGARVFAVGALLPQGYTRLLLPGYKRQDEQPLPLMGYCAAGWRDGDVYVAAAQTDDAYKWNPVNYCTPELHNLVEQGIGRYGGNRVIRQLAKCALEYRCFTAQNIFYKRWEGGIPVSSSCNARCLGCISLQPAECCPSPQARIDFEPTVEEILEIAVPHLSTAEDAIVSFGQGCEGEPSLAADAVSQAVARIRLETKAGTINMNTNAGYTRGVKEICRSGIDSLRVSAISARESTYMKYYRPRGYSWEDVCSSIAFARRQDVFVSLNLLAFPGLTDMPEEVEAMVRFIKRYDINMVQLRNLNIDPDYLASRVPLAGREVPGLSRFIEILKEEIPRLEIGSYSRPAVK